VAIVAIVAIVAFGALPVMSLARAQRLYWGRAVPASGLKELLSQRARQCGRPRVSR